MKLKNYPKNLLGATLLWTFFLTPFGEASRINALQRLVQSIKTKSITGQQKASKELGIQGSYAAQKQQLFFELLDKDPSLRNKVTKVISQEKGEGTLHLDFIDFSNRNLRGFNFEGADLEGAILARANLFGANFKGAILRRTKLEGAILDKANFEGAMLFEANFAGADLRRTNFKGAILDKADFEGAMLFEANFAGADLRRANFKGAILAGANFERAILVGANFEGTILVGANFEGASYDSKTYFPIPRGLSDWFFWKDINSRGMIKVD